MKQTDLADRLLGCAWQLQQLEVVSTEGQIRAIVGSTIEIDGLRGNLTIGDRLELIAPGRPITMAEVVGFQGGHTRAVPFETTEGLGPGGRAKIVDGRRADLSVSDRWIGRVLDPLGRAADGKGPLPPGDRPRPTRVAPPPAVQRARLGPRIGLGVRAIDCFATCRAGQRLGLFAGSGVGKSTLLGMLARGAACDVIVIGLIGERGREVREFLEEELGSDGLARSVAVVATSDTSPVLRRQAAETAMAVAEHFRDQGKHVLLLMDSLTRYCHALREIGLAAGEPPATRGYPPSVFAALPKLLERAGPGLHRDDGTQGRITALFTVLVEGDDTNEPIADAARGILDGHILLDRRIAESGRYPPVDVLRSLSRAASSVLEENEAELVRKARGVLAVHADIADLVRLGAYRAGSDPAADTALRLAPKLEAVLRQARTDRTDIDTAFAMLAASLED